MNKLIFWDWSGTLADESELDRNLCLAMEKDMTEKRGISLERAARLFQTYLKELENTWQWHDYVRHGRCLDVDWKSCQESHLEKLKPVKGAKEILEYAHKQGYHNILATNAVRQVILIRADHIGILNLFDTIIASDDAQALKASGRHFQIGLSSFQGNPGLSFSIGDNPVQDIRPARLAGMKTVFCDYGKQKTHYHSPHLSPNHDEQDAPEHRIDNLKELMSIL